MFLILLPTEVDLDVLKIAYKVVVVVVVVVVLSTSVDETKQKTNQ